MVVSDAIMLYTMCSTAHHDEISLVTDIDKFFRALYLEAVFVKRLIGIKTLYQDSSIYYLLHPSII